MQIMHFNVWSQTVTEKREENIGNLIVNVEGGRKPRELTDSLLKSTVTGW